MWTDGQTDTPTVLFMNIDDNKRYFFSGDVYENENEKNKILKFFNMSIFYADLE